MELENKPPSTPLAQQALKSWNFKFSLRAKGILYIISGILFIIMGSLVVAASDSVIEHKKRYDHYSGCKVSKNVNCSVTFDLKEHMHSDVFLYYSIGNMYQNHRSYTKSLNVKQLLGDDPSKSQLEKSCDPVNEMKDIDYPYNTSLFEPTQTANPCGLIANSFFNDTFSLTLEGNNVSIEIDTTNIALYKDKKEKFKNSSDSEEKRWIDIKDGNFYIEHFIVWVSNAATPTFRKLWGKINGLEKGRYTMHINSNYDVRDFSGKKYVILTTHSTLGGKVNFLGIISIVIGVTAFLGSSLFFMEDYYKRLYGIKD